MTAASSLCTDGDTPLIHHLPRTADKWEQVITHALSCQGLSHQKHGMKLMAIAALLSMRSAYAMLCSKARDGEQG